MPPPTTASTRLLTLAKGKQPAKSSKAKSLYVLSEVTMTEAEQMKLATKRSLQQTHISQASGSGADEGTSIIPGVPDVATDESDEEISWKSSDEDNDDDDVDDQENSDNEGNDDASLGMNVGCKEGQDVEDDDEELYKDVNINLEGRYSLSVSSQFVTSMLNLSPDAGIDSLFESTPRVDVQATTTVAPLTLTAPTLPPPTIPTISQIIKEQVKVQVSKILPKIEKTVNEQLEAEVLTQSSNTSKTSYAVIGGDKIILDTYGYSVMFKRRHDDANKDKNPPLDQTGGPSEEENKKSQSQQALQRKRRPRPLASLLKGLNLIKRLQASLHQQRSQCRQLKI
uniref:Uncharacterized protein n=1 Tax=Tanacetum cinerariifolium TaxID=118510 RepID=A0A6L2KP37_TANCI|nr:hypothetical protein [Tanacetum cinerariifolium]